MRFSIPSKLRQGTLSGFVILSRVSDERACPEEPQRRRDRSPGEAVERYWMTSEPGPSIAVEHRLDDCEDRDVGGDSDRETKDAHEARRHGGPNCPDDGARRNRRVLARQVHVLPVGVCLVFRQRDATNRCLGPAVLRNGLRFSSDRPKLERCIQGIHSWIRKRKTATVRLTCVLAYSFSLRWFQFRLY